MSYPIGVEDLVRTITSTTTTTSTSASTGTHRARYRERLAGVTAVTLPVFGLGSDPYGA